MAQSLSHSKWLCKYYINIHTEIQEKVYYQLRADIQKIIKDLCNWNDTKYIREQEKEDQIMDKLKTKEYTNPFKGRSNQPSQA